MTSTAAPPWPSLKDQAANRGLDPKLVELAGKADEAIRKGDEAVRKGIDKAGTYAAENRDKVEGMLDKAATEFNTRTGGKYQSQVSTVRTQVAKGVDLLAAQGRSAQEPVQEPTQEPNQYAGAEESVGSDEPTDPAAPTV